ncbi:MAG: hypothetical protein KKH21_05325, partial [Gammaproteobacteria bacterium]|nr:hypothetical protein [Gammaproteobacteria bacterium]MBU1817339.1 hypothetical protein [Gammaproteobacteria bacterium]
MTHFVIFAYTAFPPASCLPPKKADPGTVIASPSSSVPVVLRLIVLRAHKDSHAGRYFSEIVVDLQPPR